MKPIIDIRDNKDADLLCEAIKSGIRELVDIRDKAVSWGCSSTELQDRIDRLTRMMRSLCGD